MSEIQDIADAHYLHMAAEVIRRRTRRTRSGRVPWLIEGFCRVLDSWGDKLDPPR